MNARIREKLARRKKRIQKRLDKSNLHGCSKPMFTARNIQYEIGERGRGIGYGGIGAMHLLVRKLGFAEAIDRRLHLLQIHLPYHESDHVLNLAYNALCDGTCLEDIELRRNGSCPFSESDPDEKSENWRSWQGIGLIGCRHGGNRST